MNKNNPFFSVIIPTYNNAKLLIQCLDSLRAQTFSNWEALVIDNNSKDETIKIVRKIASRKIKLFKINNDGIIAKSRNYGINQSKGQYIAFLDSDDLWDSNRLEFVHACIKKKDIDLVSHPLKIVGSHFKKIDKVTRMKISFESLFYNGNCLTPSATVVRKKNILAAGGFNENPKFNTCEDYHLWLKLLKNGIKVHILNKPLGSYRIYTGNQSNDTEQVLNANLKIFNTFKPKINRLDFLNKIKIQRRLAFIYYSAGRGHYLNKRFNLAYKYLSKTIQIWPLIPRAYLALTLAFIRAIF